MLYQHISHLNNQSDVNTRYSLSVRMCKSSPLFLAISRCFSSIKIIICCYHAGVINSHLLCIIRFDLAILFIYGMGQRAQSSNPCIWMYSKSLACILDYSLMYTQMEKAIIIRHYGIMIGLCINGIKSLCQNGYK